MMKIFEERKNTCLQRKRKKRKIFGEGKGEDIRREKSIFFVEENEKEGNIWSRKLLILRRRRKMEKEKGKGGKYLENENIWFMEEKKKEKENEETIFLARRRITEGKRRKNIITKGKLLPTGGRK